MTSSERQFKINEQGSFLYLRRPVRHNGQRRVRLCLYDCVDQKPLPVGRHGIGRQKGEQNSPSAELKERGGRARIETLAAYHRRHHQLPVSRIVEQLPTITPPARSATSAGRDLPLAAAIREAPHVNLKPSRLIRGVGQPPPVGRERPRSFISFRLDHGERRLATPWRRQDPYIPFRLRVGLVIDNEAPVPRPVGGNFVVI